MQPIAIAEELTQTAAAEADDFEEIVRLYRPKIFRFALASLRDRDAAETLTQDCFVRAHRARHAFRNECSLGTWLMQIAVNLIRDYGRSRKLAFWRKLSRKGECVDKLAAQISAGQTSPEKQAVLRQEVQAIWAAAAHLPERQRTVFLLRFVEDMDVREIVIATGMAESTVKTHLFRALQTIRETVGSVA